MTIVKCRKHKVKKEVSEIDGEKYCPICEDEFWNEEYDLHEETNHG